MQGEEYIPLIDERTKKEHPLKIILFGSYAYGNPTAESDLDILVVTNDNKIPNNFREKSKIYLKYAHAIKDIQKECPVDLIIHTQAMHKQFIETDSMFARELLSKGKVLYEKNNKGLA
jgi:predicted nucleotidyltransferase